jgi:polyphosphate kinase
VTTTDDITAAADLTDPRLYLNRELSWLAFNARVVALARDPRQPLLERCKFLAIAGSNLDEFFMVRVAAMQEAIAAGRRPSTPDRMPREAVLDAVSDRVSEMVAEQSRIWRDELHPALENAGVYLRGVPGLPESARRDADERFERQVFPVLTPLAVGPGLPFPYISGLSLNLGLLVRDPKGGETRFARVKVPPGLPRLFPADGCLVPLEDLIQEHVGRLFPGMEVARCTQFRVTRDADFDISDDADDLLGAVEDQLHQRRFGHVVRLEVAADAPAELIDTLTDAMSIGERDVYRVEGMLDLTALWALADLDRPDLRDAQWRPVTAPRLRAQDDQQIDMFAAIRSGDILVHHPYDDFHTSVERFVQQAVDDPNVLAIKQTMYRTSGDSPLVTALLHAAEEGKQTVCLVEVKARFDEERNIRWARDLERSGVHVVYGIPGLKTHAKLALVVRREGDSVRRYVHIGTGNYHPRTARLYTDFGLFTCDDNLTEDVADLFNYLTGFGRPPEYRTILVAPNDLRDGLIDEIERVVAAHRGGTPGRVVLKMNSLVDGPCIEAIYRASQAGVPVDLIVRGICALRPGVTGISENIRVVSLVGRFLEHARVFAFFSGDDTRVFMGSADMMVRNLDHRVEVVAPILDPTCRREIEASLELALTDTALAWSLDAEGQWSQIAPADGAEPFDSQEALMGRARST